MPIDEPAEDAQQPKAQPIRLVGGVNFPTWPDLKWSRGSSHVALLQSKFVEWHASAPVSVEAVLREDKMGFDFVARVPKGIPKHEWSLDLGDALHNLRSAFDAAAWGLAHFNDAKPARPKAVHFPICTDEKMWKKALDEWVGDIDPELQERLRIMQPFTYTTTAEDETFLSVLHSLDIQDKHRDILTVSADLHQINLEGSYEYRRESDVAAPRVEMFPDVKFGDCARLGTLDAGAPIKMVGQMILRPAMKVQLTHRDRTYDVLPLLQQFVTESRRHLDILMFGLAPPDEPGWAPMDVGPSSS